MISDHAVPTPHIHAVFLHCLEKYCMNEKATPAVFKGTQKLPSTPEGSRYPTPSPPPFLPSPRPPPMGGVSEGRPEEKYYSA